MGEIASSAESTSSDCVSSRRTTKSTPGQVGAEGGSERGTGGKSTDIGGNTGSLVSADIPLQAGLDRRDEGVGGASGEVAATSLADGSGTVDRLAIDAGICRLVS